MTAPNQYLGAPISVSPATSLRAITPSDSVDITDGPCRALWCTVAGDLAVVAIQDSVAEAVTIPVETGLVPVAARRVLATGTTATVVALY